MVVDVMMESLTDDLLLWHEDASFVCAYVAQIQGWIRARAGMVMMI